MLRVDRHAVPVPEAFVGDDSLAARELAEAAAHYADFDPDDPERSKSFGFDVYKHDSVKEALRALFHGKCAYCESFFAATSPVDVEHYRPKAAIVVEVGGERRTIKPGYWWLAADWENLLPSCIDCNRMRTHDISGGDEAKLGKANAFPLADEARRAHEPGDEAGETRLLVDPCRDDPGTVLSFHFEEATRVVRVEAAPGVDALRARMADASIRTYGLNRLDLSGARGDRYLRALHQATAVIEVARELRGDPASQSIRERLAKNLRELDVYRADESEYAASGRTVVDPVVAKVRQLLGNLLAAELAGAPSPSDDPIDRFLALHPATEPVADLDAILAGLDVD